MLKLLKDDKSGKIFYKGVNVKEAKKCVYLLHPMCRPKEYPPVKLLSTRTLKSFCRLLKRPKMKVIKQFL